MEKVTFIVGISMALVLGPQHAAKVMAGGNPTPELIIYLPYDTGP